MRRASFALGLAACIALIACHPTSAVAPDDAPDVEGVIISLLQDGRALVEATFRAGAYPDTFYVIPAGEILVRSADGSLRQGDRSDLVIGRRVRAWLTGVELRSLPPQYPARIMEVR